MLTLKPGVAANWSGFIFACYLERDLQTALEGLDSLLELTKEDKQLSK